MAYSAKIILDSVSPAGVRLTTMEVCFPRFILAELNTHRAFSRNSASSRAVPIAKMIERVHTDPVIPIEFGKNQPGMSASETIGPNDERLAREEWVEAAHRAAETADLLRFRGVHKQVVNRLLEPFLWHTAIISSTEWDNFFQQRLSPNAQPEMQEIARHMKVAMVQSTPQRLAYGQWHLPFVMQEDTFPDDSIDRLMKLSIARCARVSYLNHDGTFSPEKDLALHEKLVTGQHLSPFEHVARPTTLDADSANFKGWRQSRYNVEHNLTINA